MNQIDSYIENWSRPGHKEEGEKTFYFGNLIGLLGDSKIGIDYLHQTIEFYKRKIGNQEIPEISGLKYLDLDEQQLKLFNQMGQIKTSEEGIIYLEHNGSISNFSVEEILKKEEISMGSNLLHLGGNIFSPLARAKELENKGFSYEFHPNFIVNLPKFKSPNFVNPLDKGVKKEFYLTYPLSEEILERAQKLSNSYYSKELRYDNEKFDFQKRIEFEKGWSAISIEIYKHYIENYLKNTK